MGLVIIAVFCYFEKPPKGICDVSWLSAGHTGVVTDHDKLLAQLEKELKESQQIVKLQQQMLQVGVTMVSCNIAPAGLKHSTLFLFVG